MLQSSLEEGRIVISGASITPAARGSLLTVFSEQVPTPSSIPQVRSLHDAASQSPSTVIAFTMN